MNKVLRIRELNDLMIMVEKDVFGGMVFAAISGDLTRNQVSEAEMDPKDLASLIEETKRLRSMEEVHSFCTKLCRNYGFDHFIYGARIPTSFVKPQFIIVSGFPTDWWEHYKDNGYMRIDPTVAHCAQNQLPLDWSELEPLLQEQTEVGSFMREARDFGLKSGASFPVHNGHGEAALLSLVSGEEAEHFRSDLNHAMPFVHLLTAHIHESVRRIVEIRALPDAQKTLTARERECLLWTAEGKTSWEISKILGISERTVIFHLKNAAEKLDVNNRQQAVARAVSIGLISPQFS